MRRMLKTLGAVTALGVFVLAVPPASAAATDQETNAKNASAQQSHMERHKQMHGDGQSGMTGQIKGIDMSHMTSGDISQMMGGKNTGHHMASVTANPCAAEKDLSMEDVKNIVKGRLAWDGNKRLKLGEVKKKDADTYIADIVTVDDSLVERLEVDRKTGDMRRAK